MMRHAAALRYAIMLNSKGAASVTPAPPGGQVGSIENEFRVLDMELLAGDPDTVTEVAQHGTRFKLDFAQVSGSRAQRGMLCIMQCCAGAQQQMRSTARSALCKQHALEVGCVGCMGMLMGCLALKGLGLQSLCAHGCLAPGCTHAALVGQRLLLHPLGELRFNCSA
jgi:hypothetical protein